MLDVHPHGVRKYIWTRTGVFVGAMVVALVMYAAWVTDGFQHFSTWHDIAEWKDH